MFNPFYARPIGSDRFEQHLLTEMCRAKEQENMEKEALPDVKLILHAVPEMSSGSDPVDEGYKALAVAIFARALADYLLEYAWCLKMHNDNDPREWVHFSRCVVLENEYFRTDPKRAEIFNYVIKNVVRKDYYIQDRIKTIKEFAHKIECAV